MKVQIKRSGGRGQKRGWWKQVTGVDRTQRGAYRFQGEWLNDGEVDLPLNTVVIECIYKGRKDNRQSLVNVSLVGNSQVTNHLDQIANGMNLRTEIDKLCDIIEPHMTSQPAQQPVSKPVTTPNNGNAPRLPKAGEVKVAAKPVAAAATVTPIKQAVQGSNMGVAADKYKDGAFVFWNHRARATAMLPDDVVLMAEAAGLPAEIVPSYAGDRQIVSRVIDGNSSKLKRKGWVLTSLKRSNSQVLLSLHETSKDVEAKTADLPQVGLIEWKAEPKDAADKNGWENKITSDHPVGDWLDHEYQNLRDKITGQDWTSTLVQYIVNECYGVSFRDDGRVYWIPPSHLAKVRELQSWIKGIGVNIAIAEIDGSVQDSVTEVVRESLFDQLEGLKSEVEKFDGKQKPSTYSDRIDQLQTLRKRAIVFTETLSDLRDESADLLKSIDETDSKVEEHLEHRKQIRVKRDGTIEYL